MLFFHVRLMPLMLLTWLYTGPGRMYHMINIYISRGTDGPSPPFSEPSLSGWKELQDQHVEEIGGEFPWWGGLIIALSIVSIISVLVYKNRRSIRSKSLAADSADVQIQLTPRTGLWMESLRSVL